MCPIPLPFSNVPVSQYRFTVSHKIILQKISKSKTLISLRFLVLKNDKSLDVLERII